LNSYENNYQFDGKTEKVNVRAGFSTTIDQQSTKILATQFKRFPLSELMGGGKITSSIILCEPRIFACREPQLAEFVIPKRE